MLAILRDEIARQNRLSSLLHKLSLLINTIETIGKAPSLRECHYERWSSTSRNFWSIRGSVMLWISCSVFCILSQWSTEAWNLCFQFCLFFSPATKHEIETKFTHNFVVWSCFVTRQNTKYWSTKREIRPVLYFVFCRPLGTTDPCGREIENCKSPICNLQFSTLWPDEFHFLASISLFLKKNSQYN